MANQLCGGFYVEGKRKSFALTTDAIDPNHLRHWTQGPPSRFGVRGFFPADERTTPDGVVVPVDWLFSFFLLPQLPTGWEAETVKTLLLEAWRHSRSIAGTGVWTRFVQREDQANCIVKLATPDQPCLAPNPEGRHFGNLSCVHTFNSEARMTMRTTHMVPPIHPRVARHEGCHAIYHACDMYRYDVVEPSGYRGIMDNGEDATENLTRDDRRWMREWLAGQAQYTTC